MKIIPLIHIKKRKIVKSNLNNFENIEYLLNKYEDDFLYILDLDGIKKNQPNLCLFQKLSKKHDLWVDAGPRVIGDIVDSVIAGASKITVRKNLINNADIPNIKEIVENEIYMNITPKFFQSSNNNIIKTSVNGLVLFNNEINHLYDFKDQSYLKNIVKNKTYIYLSTKEEIQNIKKFNFEGYLVDIEKIEEFKKIGI